MLLSKSLVAGGIALLAVGGIATINSSNGAGEDAESIAMTNPAPEAFQPIEESTSVADLDTSVYGESVDTAEDAAFAALWASGGFEPVEPPK